MVRGVGLIRSIDDLGNTMLTQSGGNPVLVSDVATVTVGRSRGSASPATTDDDIVQGIVLMRRGEQSIADDQARVEARSSASIIRPSCRRACGSSGSTIART